MPEGDAPDQSRPRGTGKPKKKIRDGHYQGLSAEVFARFSPHPGFAGRVEGKCFPFIPIVVCAACGNI